MPPFLFSDCFCNDWFKHYSSPNTSEATINPRTILPLTKCSRKPLALDTESETVEAISSKLVKTTSYCVELYQQLNHAQCIWLDTEVLQFCVSLYCMSTQDAFELPSEFLIHGPTAMHHIVRERCCKHSVRFTQCAPQCTYNTSGCFFIFNYLYPRELPCHTCSIICLTLQAKNWNIQSQEHIRS